MPDILVRPAANADTDLTDAIVLNDVTLPLTNQNAAAAGLTLGTEYEFQVLGTPTTATITSSPEAFAVGDWSVATGVSPSTLDVTINSLPANNGAAITNIIYRLDGGIWFSSGGTTSFTINTALPSTEYDVEIQAQSVNGDSGPSDLKTATSGASGGFSEQASTSTNTVYIQSNAARISNAPGVLMFGSYRLTNDSRSRIFHLATTTNGPGGLYSDSTSGDSQTNPRITLPADVSGDVSATATTAAVSHPDRVNLLATGKIVGGVFTINGWYWLPGGGAGFSNTGGTTDTTFLLGSQEVFIHRRGDGSQPFAGDTYRAAIWTFADAANVPDITSQAFRDNFYDNTTGTLVDPATSYAALTGATLWVDLYTTAHFNSPTTAPGDPTFVAALTTTGTYT